MSDPSIFETRASRTGDHKYPSLVVVIPRYVRDQFNITSGDVVKLKFIEKSDGSTYPVVGDFPISVQYKRIKKLLDKHTKDFRFSNELITRTTSNSMYLYNTFTKRQRAHTLLKSIIAASLYIASIQVNDKIIQKNIAEIFGITEPTLRRIYKSGWTDDLERKHEVDDSIIGKRLWYVDSQKRFVPNSNGTRTPASTAKEG